MNYDLETIKALLNSGKGIQLKNYLVNEALKLRSVGEMDFKGMTMEERGKIATAHQLAYERLKEILSQILNWSEGKQGRERDPKDKYFSF